MKKLFFFLLFPIISYSQVQIGQNIDGESVGDLSGFSVSLSSDGNILAIGAVSNDDNGENTGHVRIYENQSNSWIQIGQDIDGESIGGSTGNSVSLSNDGNIIVIGTQSNDDNGQNSGQARIYENQNGNWVQIGQNIDGESVGDLSGFNVSLSDDGSIVAISAPGNDDNGQDSGHVRIYENQNGDWLQIGNDINGEASNDNFGWSMSLSSDGSRVAVGSRFNNDSDDIRVFENQSNNWVQIGDGINGEDSDIINGIMVSLSGDGSTVALGLNDENNIGYVGIYENQGNSWIQVGEDINGEDTISVIGKNLCLSNDGSVVAIGGIFNNNDNLSNVSTYQNQDNSWIQVGENIDGGATDNNSNSTSVSLSSDGNILAIGVTGNDDNGENAGQVRVYDIGDAILSTQENRLTNFSIFPNPANSTVAISIADSDSLEQTIIYNNLGQKVLDSKNSSIDISSLSTGLYFLEVTTSQGKGIQKLLIE